MKRRPDLYGVIAEFDNPSDIVSAARQAYEAGYRKMDAYSPYPIEELAHAIGFHRTRLPLVVLLGGLIGGIGGYLLQYWITVVDYPLNVGGRPLHSWPSFIPVTFETTILGAALAAVLGMLALNGLPRPYNPVFNARRFVLATRNRFFLCVEAADPKFDREQTTAFLKNAGASEVSDVEY